MLLASRTAERCSIAAREASVYASENSGRFRCDYMLQATLMQASCTVHDQLRNSGVVLI